MNPTPISESETHESTSTWFLREVQPHEAALRAYLRVRFPTLSDLDDLVQETFARILRVRGRSQVRSAKALLFATARNTAVDWLRRERIVRFEPGSEIEALPVSDEQPGTAEMVSRDQELQLLEEAVQSLPSRCQEILVLKKIEGLSYAEIGQRLGITANTISAQLTVGIFRCRRFLEERGVKTGGGRE